MEPVAFKKLPERLYLVTWRRGWPEQYVGRVFDNQFVALKVCEDDQVVVALQLESNDEWDDWDGNEQVGYYSPLEALSLARLWKAGKMIGGNQEQVIFALLRALEARPADSAEGDDHV